MEQVHSFVYLGSQFTLYARCEKEIRRRIGIAKSAFTSMSKVLTSRDIHMTVRIIVLRCYVWSTLLYVCETWTISVAMQKKIDTFETWLYRRMLRISWMDMFTNEEVYRRMNTKQSLLVDIVRQQMNLLGHVLRKEEMEHLVVTSFVDGKRACGMQRETFSPTSANLQTNHQWNCYDLQRTKLFGLSCVQNNNQRLYEDMILIDDDYYSKCPVTQKNFPLSHPCIQYLSTKIIS